ncbi:MAG: hypothetical protein PHV20_14310 [Bacteroidales bacterium]|nr:hypothetical protein [Bacteroidales bacterium]
MNIKKIVRKIKKKAWEKLVSKLRHTNLYPYIYVSYWHCLLINPKDSKSRSYFSAIPNAGAGIGHQMANWIAGYWFAKQFELQFAHIPFTGNGWDDFLGFGVSEESVTDLIKKGYHKVKLPLFDESNEEEILLIKKIIASYQGRKTIFIAEQDQFYEDQYGVAEDIKQKFHHAPSRLNDKLIYSQDFCNIAIHVRRGDIVAGQQSGLENHAMRWQNNDYFTTVLKNVLNLELSNKPIAIYLFSQGEESDFGEFTEFENIHFCLEMSAKESFLHMAFADILITSKSSFSYKPALLSYGIKVCPRNFWHGYPPTQDYILVDDNGNLLKTTKA